MVQVQLSSETEAKLNLNVACLAGGVGAARFLQGLVRVVPEENISVIVNTSDDIDLYGLHVSPDVDIVTYTLAGIVDEEKGWGIRGDSFHCLEALRSYGYETWFNLGDRDLATSVHRTYLLSRGLSLLEVTGRIAASLGVKVKIIPMSNNRVQTKILTRRGLKHFQEYLVRDEAKEDVEKVVFEGIEKAKPTREALSAILNADVVFICPSNPVVSIGPILSLEGVRDTLRKTAAKIVAVSPIVRGKPIKGPADKLMAGVGLEVSAYSVASLYSDFVDVFIIDGLDSGLKSLIEKLGLRVIATDTIMRNLEDKVKLARTALNFVSG